MRMPDLKSINYEEEQVVEAAEPDGIAADLNCSVVTNKKSTDIIESKDFTEFENCAGFSFKGYNENQTFLNSHQNDSAAHNYLQRALHEELS